MSEAFHLRLEERREKTKRRNRNWVIATCLFFFLAGGAFAAQSERFQKKYIYPYPHQELVAQYAAQYRVESSLVAGVIMSESKFQDEVHSDRGAVGLMQLMPTTAAWVAEQIEYTDYSMEKLHEPATNIRFGTWYLSSLQKEFCGNEVLMLAAYNAGRGTVHSWMEERGWDMNFTDVNQIPYEETRLYIGRVLKKREKYRDLYERNY